MKIKCMCCGKHREFAEGIAEVRSVAGVHAMANFIIELKFSVTVCEECRSGAMDAVIKEICKYAS